MDKVERVFQRLKTEGKIQIARDIVIKKSVPNFKAGIFKKIKYNERMMELSEEGIEFCLLHEEGHFKIPVKIRDWTYLVILILSLLPLKYLPNSTVLGFLFLFLYLFLLHVWIIEIYQKYEYFSDEYACSNLSNPLERISALERIPKNRSNKWVEYFLITIGAGYMHPSIEERKSRIKEIFSKETN